MLCKEKRLNDETINGLLADGIMYEDDLVYIENIEKYAKNLGEKNRLKSWIQEIKDQKALEPKKGNFN